MKLILFGASGSGTTTLGRELEKRTGFKHLDLDEYYWKKTNPPFQEKTPLIERNNNLKADLKKFGNVIVSGSMVSWGKEWEKAFDLAVFIRLENEERMKRLKKREVERYGEQLFTDKKIQQNSKAFLEWANQYENPNFGGRSLAVHKKWMASLDCKVLRVNGQAKPNSNAELIMNEIETKDQLPVSPQPIYKPLL